MKLAAMQPYLFPYLGYFQLIYAVDTFIFDDDVQYIKKGWINRNRILVNCNPHMFVFNLKKDSSHLKIRERFLSDDIDFKIRKFEKTLYYHYKYAPHFHNVMNLLSDIFANREKNIACYTIYSLRKICDLLEIKRRFIVASDINYDVSKKKEDRVLDIIKVTGAKHFINAIGGRALYSKARFAEEGIRLNFIQMKNIVYPQFGNSFKESLSIIDVLMFNSIEKTKELLNAYDLV